MNAKLYAGDVVAAPFVSSHRKRAEEFAKMVDQSEITTPHVVYACNVHAGAVGVPTGIVCAGHDADVPFAQNTVHVTTLFPAGIGPNPWLRNGPAQV